MKTRRLTQVDVAKLAGVSQAAVSQVLNCNDSTRPKETRQRILDAIDRLGYVPNTLAQSLGNLIAYLYNRIS
jgi:LacI family transcriptional regulator